MSPSDQTSRTHSSEYFGKERDFWWNSDFLDLMAQRLELATVRRAADIGCGVGHWSVLLYPRLASGAEMVGIDQEQTYLADYLSRLRSVAPDPSRISAAQGDAYKLLLPDNHFDLTTCQTLLLHLEKPQTAMAEMIRITRPGGMVVCSEPNNLIARLPIAGPYLDQDIERLISASELAWRYVIGRARLGKGAEYIGEALPGMFAKLGLEDVRVWLSDKASPSIPPYDSDMEVAALEAWRKWMADGSGPFDRAEARTNVLAGGGSESFFDAAWQADMETCRDMLAARQEGSWHAAGGGLHYIVAGRVPG